MGGILVGCGGAGVSEPAPQDAPDSTRTAPAEPPEAGVPPDRRTGGSVELAGERKRHLGEPVDLTAGDVVLAVCGSELREQAVRVRSKPAYPRPAGEAPPDNPVVEVECDDGPTPMFRGLALSPGPIGSPARMVWGAGLQGLPAGHALSVEGHRVEWQTPSARWTLWEGTSPVVHAHVPIAGDLDGDGQLDLVLEVVSADHPPPRLFLSKGGFHLAATGRAWAGPPLRDGPPPPEDALDACSSAEVELRHTRTERGGRLQAVTPDGTPRWSFPVSAYPHRAWRGLDGSFDDVSPLCLVEGSAEEGTTYVVDTRRGVRAVIGNVGSKWAACDGALFVVEYVGPQALRRIHRIDPAQARITHTRALPGQVALKACEAASLLVRTADGAMRLPTADLGLGDLDLDLSGCGQGPSGAFSPEPGMRLTTRRSKESLLGVLEGDAAGEVKWSFEVEHLPWSVAPRQDAPDYRDTWPLCVVEGHVYYGATYLVHMERGVQAELGSLASGVLACAGAVFAVEHSATEAGAVAQIVRMDPTTATVSHRAQVRDLRWFGGCRGEVLLLASDDGPLLLDASDLSEVPPDPSPR